MHLWLIFKLTHDPNLTHTIAGPSLLAYSDSFMMNRIEHIFNALRAQGKRGLMPYLTAGDPDLATTSRLIEAIDAAGASVIEIGFPFSDPVADGPTIQASMTYALDHGVCIAGIFDAVKAVRPKVQAGLVAMVSFSMVHRYGVERFVRDAAAAGFDGFIFPDLPLEAVGPVRQVVDQAGLILSMLIAPTSSDERAKAIASASTGFVYVVSRAGITGEQAELPAELPTRLKKLREVTPLPLAVGFGIAQASQVRQVVEVADAAIVGSALVRRVARHREAGTEEIVSQVAAFVNELGTGLQTPVDSRV